MRNLAFLVGSALALGLSVGCSKPDVNVTDGNGNNVSVSGDGTKMSSTDKDGKTTTVETGANGATVSMKDEKGTTNVETGKSVSEADLGIAFYPGSTEKAGAAMKADTPTEKDALSVRLTADDPKKVVDFYKAKLKEPKTMSMGDASADREMVTGTLDNGAKVTVTAMRDKGKAETEVSVGTVLTLKK